MHTGFIAMASAETAVAVETDGVFPTVVGLNADLPESLAPRYLEQVRDQGATNALAPVRFADRHSHNTPSLFALCKQCSGANQLAVDFCDRECMAALNIVGSNVVKVRITGLVDPSKVLAKTGLNQPAGSQLVTQFKGTNEKGHHEMEAAVA
jgi:hypothetical protein